MLLEPIAIVFAEISIGGSDRMIEISAACRRMKLPKTEPSFAMPFNDQLPSGV